MAGLLAELPEDRVTGELAVIYDEIRPGYPASPTGIGMTLPHARTHN